jgi:tyrosine-protein phosphatase SIW14
MDRRKFVELALTGLVALPNLPAGAAAMQMNMVGVPNLNVVSRTLYRSAQPTAVGFQNLARFGIRSVISLRQSVNDAPLALNTNLALHHIRMRTWDVSQNESALIVEALAILQASLRLGKTLVHCTHGADRTGLIIALWRILYQGWAREDAIIEMETGGFGYHHMWVNIPHYIRIVDLAALRARIQTASKL